MEELDAIIARMTSDGRTKAEKATVVKEWKKRNPEKFDISGNTTDSPTRTQAAESNVTGSGSGDGLLDSPESGKDVVKNLINIDNNTTYEKDVDLKQSILERYFEAPNVDLSKIEGAKTIDSPMGAPVDWSTIKFEDATTASEDQLKKHFGEQKYDLYKKYQETGNLNKEDIPEGILPAFEEIVDEETKKRSRFLKEDQVRKNKDLLDESFYEAITIDEDVRGLYSTDFIEDYSEQEKLAQKETRSIDFGGMAPVNLTQKEKKKIAGAAVEKQNKYLTDVSTVLNEDLNSYDKYLQGIGIKGSDDLEAYLGDQSIDIETRRNVLNKNNELNKRIKDFQKQSIKFGDKMGALEALDKNYDWGYRAGLSLEKAILGDIGQIVLGVGAMTADVISPESRAAEYLKNNYVAHIDYAESIQQKQEANLPATIKFADVGLDNAGTFIGQQLGNNIFSIGTALTYGGVVKNITSKPVKKYAKRALQSTFFGVEGGSKLSDMEIAQKNSAKNLDYINNRLENEELTPDKRLQLEEEKEKSLKALNYTQSQRAFTALTYGGIATAAETLGTMRWIDDISAMRKLTGDLSMKSILRGTGNFIIKAPGTELLEETATQVGHNLMDNLILKDNKSLIEGVDADFFASTFITSLAIGGPSIAPGVRNAFRNSVQTKEETQKFRDLATEFIENKYILKEGTNLSKGGINKNQADFIKARQLEILDEVGQTDINAFSKISDLDANQITNLFDISRKQGALYSKNFEIGTTGLNNDAIKRDRDKLNKEYNDLQSEKEAILNEPAKKRNQKLKETAKEEGLEESDAMKQSFNYGRAAYYDNLVKGLGKKVIKFDGENALADLEKYLNDNSVDASTKAQIIKGFNEGGNGTFNGNDILTFERNRRVTMMFGTDIQKADAIQVAVHELQHQYDIEKGLVKDGKIVASHRPLVTALQDHVKELFNTNQISKDIYNQFKRRVDQYREKVNKNKVIDQTELLTLLGTMKRAGMLKDEKISLLYEVKSLINSVRAKFLKENATLLDMRTTSDVLRYIDTFNKKVDQGKTIAQLPPEEEVISKESKGMEQKTPEELVKIIQRGGNPRQVKNAEDALVPQYEAMVVEALKYNEAKGDIKRENVVSAAREYYKAIVKNYDPKKGKFSTHVYGNIAPKNDTIFEKAKTLEKRDEGISLDAPEARQVAGDAGVTTNTEDTFVQKINILQDFAIANRVANKIKALVKVAKGDNFKSIISKYAGKVGELIFDIPANKIMDGKANLAAVTKYTEGMPAPAEAQNIQRVFNAPNNADKFIKTLPLYNVTDKTADINKIGENLDVSRDTYGYAIGIKGLPLDYFYENYTDPTGEITSPKGRSKGLTSQTPVKRLKPQFRKPTPETVEQFKKDLGITPKNEANVYSRDIGQLLKGVAKVYSMNAALSGAQRAQEAKLKTAPAAEKQAIKQQTADITAAQSKAAFSEGLVKVDNIVKVLDALELDTKGIDKLFESLKIEATYDLSTVLTEEGREEFFKILKKDLFPLMPKEFWFSIEKDGRVTADVFTASHSNYGDFSMGKYKQKDKEKGNIPKGKKVGDFKSPKEKAGYDTFRNEIRKLANDDTIKFGANIDGANFNLSKSYKTMFGTQEKRNDREAVDQWNKDVALIHRVMWERFNKAMQNDKDGKAARAIGSYIKLTANDKQSWHRLGAQVVGFSKNLKGKKIENEHAMPATQAYLYLMKSSLDENIDFKSAYDLIIENYKLIVLDKAMDEKLTNARTARGYSLRYRMPDAWSVVYGNWWQRYFNDIVFDTDGIGIDPNSIVGLDGKTTFATMFNVNARGVNKVLNTDVNQKQNFSEGVKKARVYDKNTKARGMSAFDFDETVGVSQNYVIATKDGETKRIASDRWPFVGDDLLQQGWKMDFTDFNRVTDGKPGPLMQKMKNQIKKFGPKNVFILTARAPESQQAIHEYLKSEGINIPLENITGLGNSTGEAKALWMLNKFAEGYNDMYFVDDALPNVKAVKNVLEQLDIKSKVVQAKINFSEGLDKNFNDILETLTGIESKKRFDFIKARKRGAGKGKFRLFIPPSHEDFVGLLYNFIGKGREGDAHREFFEEALVRPLNRANREYDTARQSVATDYKNLNKQMPEVKKMFNKKTPDGDFVYQDAIRVYLWDKHGYDIPGLSPIDQKNLVELVKSDSKLQSYAETINTISKQETYVDPTDGWDSGDIRMDLDDATGRIGRAQFFEEFNKNADIVFSKENLNKIEAGYGKGVREALEDMLYRIKTGRNKPSGQGKMVNDLMNWVNGSVGSVMFFNMRSALLQQMSIVNYINFADNNIYAAAKAFANQKQYWADWSFIFNSDMLKQRRGGIQTDINGAELAAEMRKSKNPHRFLISKLLELGFLPTQIGDNIAIATGGATYYRNRINTYLKQGLSKTEAEAKAFTDFQDITQSTQQSARPDMVSQQQASVIGKVILNFQNVTSQFNRLAKKAFLDIKNRRITKPNTTQMQSDISNAARITYYLAIQNLIFYTLQTAMFAMLFDDDEEDVNNLFLKKRERLINGSIDSVLRGTGMFGAILSTLKNTAIAYARQRDVNYNPDESAVLVEALNFSPVLGIKARKVVNAEKTLNYNKKVIEQMSDFDIDNPQWSAVTNYIEAGTNMPLNRLYNKTQNVRQTLNNEHAAWERTLMFLGWSQYNLNLKNEKMEAIKAKTKKKKSKKQKFTF